MENSEPKKSKQVTNSDLSDVESMHSASSSSEEESEIETKTSTKPETAQTEENNDSDTENNNGFTVVTRKKRVPPIIIDESMNTPELLKELSEKTGNKTHLGYLENLTPIKNPSPSALSDLYIDCNRELRALDALGENTQLYGRILASKILRAFPHDICRNWVVFSKRENLAEGDITKLMKLLAEEVEGAVVANNIKGLLVSKYSIKSFLENFNVRSKPVTKDKYCCPKCKKKHVSICKTPTGEQSVTASTNKIDILKPNFVHLQTARVFITGPTGITKLTRCLLDGGSQCSFISSDLVNSLKLPIISTRPLELQAFESPSSLTRTGKQVQFQLSSIWDKSKVNIIAFESLNKYESHPPPPIDA
ncbi:integrase catalytic domain-containing protein [Nephila pilipes]|uniref:Integrase catalytic domain-containing protein n=1 Tax=Nephila pilipes TaxID=299642 RepID=A0A8X6QBQ2_NEPPI|nr:integrase catalytic domain-containing protein [Nephila pilipes]